MGGTGRSTQRKRGRSTRGFRRLSPRLHVCARSVTLLISKAGDPDRTSWVASPAAAHRHGTRPAEEGRLLPWVNSRLVLRKYELTDADDVWEAIHESRASLIRWVPTIGRQTSVDTVRQALHQLTLLPVDYRLSLSLWERHSGRFAGEVGLYDMDLRQQVGEVGYWLRESSRGQGYATEALAGLMVHALRAHGLRRFVAYVPTENIASRRVLRRLGFQLAAHYAKVGPGHAETMDMLTYALDTGTGQPCVGVNSAP